MISYGYIRECEYYIISCLEHQPVSLETKSHVAAVSSKRYLLSILPTPYPILYQQPQLLTHYPSSLKILATPGIN